MIFSPNEQRARGGGGGALPDHELDWPPCKVVFFGLATNALDVKNIKNNKTRGLSWILIGFPNGVCSIGEKPTTITFCRFCFVFALFCFRVLVGAL